MVNKHPEQKRAGLKYENQSGKKATRFYAVPFLVKDDFSPVSHTAKSVASSPQFIRGLAGMLVVTVQIPVRSLRLSETVKPNWHVPLGLSKK
jgi:hypothetical protein